MENKRTSNFELLRIIAMLMIISLHQNGTANALATLVPGQVNYYLSHIAESLSICSVNCFVLISGYFMIGKDSAPIKKCLHLLIDVAFWGLLGCALSFLIYREAVGFYDIVINVVPYIKGHRWFVRDYIILMLFVPFLNNCLVRLSKQTYRILLAITLLIFSVWPSFFPNPPIDDYGYSCVHFIQLYIVAGYLKLHLKKAYNPVICFAGYLISVILIFASAMLGMSYSYAYNYLFVITASVSLFLLFKNISIKSSFVNALASNSFDIFLIHTTTFFAGLIYVRLFNVETSLFGSSITYLIGLLLCPPVFYLFCSLLAAGKHWVFSKTIDRWLDKLPIKNYSVI